MSNKSIYSTIDQIFKENGFARRIRKLDYPFLSKLSNITLVLDDQLRKINILAHDAYSPGDSLMPIDQLVEWQSASPDSWLVCIVEGEIVGNIDVEPLSRIKGDAIRDGLAHEGQIGSADILDPLELTDGDYIHIGSIVSRFAITKKAKIRVGTRLLAGITDRVLNLWTLKNGGAHHIIAVNYPDADNKYHAQKLFKRFGFEHQEGWQTAEGEDVYILDLNKHPNSALRKLQDAVITRRELHRRERWRKRQFWLGVTGIALTLILLIIFIILDWIPLAVISLISFVSALITIIMSFETVYYKFIKIGHQV